MGIKSILKDQAETARYGTPTPPWWKLATVVFAVLFGVFFMFSTFRSSAEPSAAEVPGFITPGSGQSTEVILLGPSQGPGEEAAPTVPTEPTEETSTEPATEPTAEPAPQESFTPVSGASPATLDAAGLVLAGALSDDGALLEIAGPAGLVSIPRNLGATALAALYAQTSKDVAAALPMLPGSPQPSPSKNFPDAMVGTLEIQTSPEGTFILTGEVDKDGFAGTKKPILYEVRIVNVDGKYYVQQAGKA